MWQNSEIARRLELAAPILQGPFGGGLSTPRLAAAVSNSGGLGSYGAYTLAPDEIAKVARDIRALTSQPFALNLWVSDHDPGGLSLSAEDFERVWCIFEPYFLELGAPKPERPERFHHAFEDQAEALLDARPAAFSFVFGVPSAKILAECRRRNIVTIGTATSITEALCLEAAGVDFLIATGFEAGGHRPSFLMPAEVSLMGTFALSQVVADRVRIPVISAGGIVDARGIAPAIALGAQGVQIGTAFLACEESGTTPEHRAILFSERAQFTTLTRTFTGRLARGVPNRWVDEMTPRLRELPPFPIQAWFSAKLKAAAAKAGRTDLVALWAGQATPNLRHRTAPELMASLINADLP
jgi:nitronate monooxygenase